MVVLVVAANATLILLVTRFSRLDDKVEIRRLQG
jgi:hypothetical protein